MPPVAPLAERSPLVRALLADEGMGGGRVDVTIDPRDEMLGFLVQSHLGDRDRALFTYLQSGMSIADSLCQILRWRFGDVTRVGKLLDFASGYGRVTRFLVREVPPEKVWVSDVYAAGVEFQQRRFGVHGIVSTVRPEDFHCAAAFDAVFVTSLFTHLPEERFVAWLRVLMSVLTPGGVLVFSVHDQGLLAPGLAMPAEGILFQEISESGSLAVHDYGSTWVSESFVRDALGRAVGGGASLQRLARGLCNFQDLYVAVPEAEADFSGLSYRGEPYLYVERCQLSAPDLLELRGWAGVLGSGGLVEVQALLDEQLLGVFPIEVERPDVAALLGDQRYLRSGWGGSCRLPAGASRSGSIFRLRVLDERRIGFPAAASSLEAALLDASRREVGFYAAELGRAEGRIAAAAAESAALRAQIAAMEASRFWKMRNLWFRCKRMLGFGERP
ncbi:MAG TPA: class I SAM-dependent methyltransferase [Thermoanaerobaculia bacterium]|nr:class I SAM-dependent methyltransferase [Thermoanaerobaculia bacterium]